MPYDRRGWLWTLRTFFLCNHTFSNYVHRHRVDHDLWAISLGGWQIKLFLHCTSWPATDQLWRFDHLYSFFGRSLHILSQSWQEILYSLTFHHLCNLFFLLLLSLSLCLNLIRFFLLVASCSLWNIRFIKRVANISKGLIQHLLILLCRSGRIWVIFIELELELFWFILLFLSSTNALQKSFCCVVHTLCAGLTESMYNYRNETNYYSRCFFIFDVISKWDFPPWKSSSSPGSGLISSTGNRLSVFPLYLDRTAEKRMSS